ncbi:MAG: PLP-dependent cysteine synthase family protein, partial [Clostridia bacterium]
MFEKNSGIGNTPMIKINYEFQGEEKSVYTKLEYYNLSGSIKDRVAYYIITKAKQRGELIEGMPIVEATSGNTGIALAALGSYYNHPVYIFMPDWASKERIELMKGYGANVILISKEQGGFITCVEQSKELAKKLNGFLANQFANQDNFLAHYETTAEEIIEQAPSKLGGFVSGVG